MPIYEFVCESCGSIEEKLQKLSDPPPGACLKCGGKMAKIMSLNSFQLKGGGWYKDLYSSAGAPASGGGSSTASGSSAASSSAAPAAAPSAASPASAPASSAPSGGDSGGKSSASGSTASSGKSDA